MNEHEPQSSSSPQVDCHKVCQGEAGCCDPKALKKMDVHSLDLSQPFTPEQDFFKSNQDFFTSLPDGPIFAQALGDKLIQGKKDGNNLFIRTIDKPEGWKGPEVTTPLKEEQERPVEFTSPIMETQTLSPEPVKKIAEELYSPPSVITTELPAIVHTGETRETIQPKTESKIETPHQVLDQQVNEITVPVQVVAPEVKTTYQQPEQTISYQEFPESIEIKTIEIHEVPKEVSVTSRPEPADPAFTPVEQPAIIALEIPQVEVKIEERYEESSTEYPEYIALPQIVETVEPTYEEPTLSMPEISLITEPATIEPPHREEQTYETVITVVETPTIVSAVEEITISVPEMIIVSEPKPRDINQEMPNQEIPLKTMIQTHEQAREKLFSFIAEIANEDTNGNLELPKEDFQIIKQFLIGAEATLQETKGTITFERGIPQEKTLEIYELHNEDHEPFIIYLFADATRTIISTEPKALEAIKEQLKKFLPEIQVTEIAPEEDHTHLSQIVSSVSDPAITAYFFAVYCLLRKLTTRTCQCNNCSCKKPTEAIAQLSPKDPSFQMVY